MIFLSVSTPIFKEPTLEQKEELISLFKYLGQLVRDPIQSIKSIPKIRFSTLLVFQFILCGLSVLVSNLLAPYAINTMTIVLSIIGTFMGISILSMGFYYFFSIFFSRELSFRSLFTLILFCGIPFAVCHFFYYYFPVADLIGFAITCVLMVVGLVENYQVSKKAAMRIMAVNYVLFALFWIATSISTYDLYQHSAPQSLDDIEDEMESEQ